MTKPFRSEVDVDLDTWLEEHGVTEQNQVAIIAT